MKPIGRDKVTGEPLMWSGRGRPPTYASAASRDLDLYLGYARGNLDTLLTGGDGPLGRFATPEHARNIAREAMALSNRIFNALRAAKAAAARSPAADAGESRAGGSSEERAQR